MRPLFATLLLLGFLLFSCRREANESMYLKAEVITASDISCNVPLLSFEEDSANIRKVTGGQGLIYGVTQLPDSLRIQNKKLFVLVKNLDSKDEFVCNALGIMYPHLQILAAKER